ncbi:MAG: hypothetical protein JNM34_00335 [Chthonomonadaceae bacterium]|jgi:hypothetical protein|nr:hypothetical protein [Chthonomonadaceae bacterium]
MTFPSPLDEALMPLFDTLPLERAMPDLLPHRPADQTALKVARGLVATPEVSRYPELVAGVWLYVDDLEQSHLVSQSITSLTGSFWHAIMHRREGDFENALYWYRSARAHPVMDRISDYSPDLIVQLAKEGDSRAVALQRLEWATLFEWTASQRWSG